MRKARAETEVRHCRIEGRLLARVVAEDLRQVWGCADGPDVSGLTVTGGLRRDVSDTDIEGDIPAV
jgi:hypothetical protein